MIKVYLMMRRAPHLTHEEFAAYWAGPHADLALSQPDPRRRRYAQSHHRDHPVAHAYAESRNAMVGNFDGIAEAWYDSFDALLESGAETPAGFAQAVLEDERKFIDLERSIIWFAEEFVREDS